MKLKVLLIQLALLFVLGSNPNLFASPTSIDDMFFPITPVEYLEAPFSIFGGVTSTNQYSGLIKIRAGGVGQNNADWKNEVEAFYGRSFYQPGVGPLPLPRPWEPNPDYYGLNISFTGCAAYMECGGIGINEYITFIDGVGYVTPGTRPAFSEDHIYTFIIDIGPAWNFLTFGNGDGGVSDNSGSYYLEVTEVTPIPEPRTMLLFGSGLLLLIGFKRKVINNN